MPPLAVLASAFWLFAESSRLEADPDAVPAGPAVPKAVEIPRSKPCRLFLLGGQSNMDGCGRAEELPESYRTHPDNVVVWDNRRQCWVPLAEDSTAIARHKQFGPEVAFAHRLAKAFPDETIAITKTSAGGTKLYTQWLPGKSMYERFIRNFRNAAGSLKEAGVSCTIGGMLWMQGESDSETLEMANAYEANLKRMFADVRKQTGCDTLPIVMGRISSSLLKKTPWNFDHARVVQAAQERIAASDPHVHIINTDTLSTLKDNTHFDTEAQLTLGREMAGIMLGELCPDGASVAPLRGLDEVAHDRVVLRGGFWGPRLETHHQTTIPHVLDALERNGHVANFDIAAGTATGELRGHHAFDSDLHKAMEGAMYILQHFEDPELLRRVEGILDRILAAQQDDGFLISYFIVRGLEKKWDNLRTEHQMYNAGHFFEMAVAHHRLTRDPRALEAARRFADHIDRIFGPGKQYDVGGHEEIELALVKLYRATGEPRYLDLCRFLLDERGHAHGSERKPFTPSPLVIPERAEGQDDNQYNRVKRMARLRWRNGRMQDHMPLVEQAEAVGHAVRAGYVYSAMADVARFSNAPEYSRAVEAIWRDVVGRKMYVTGGIGTAQYGDEGFGDPYLLPNKAYNESCASIAHVLWQQRMNLLAGEAKYADVMELVLYNAALSGISLGGDGFFYQNPIESRQGAERRPWISLACCPSNLARFIPQVGGFLYTRDGRRLCVNLFAAGEAAIDMRDGRTVTIRQKTDYPWDGRIELALAPDEPFVFDLSLRIPGWALGKPVPSDLYRFADQQTAPVTLTINGKPADATPEPDGYVHLNRRWEAGDFVRLDLPMTVRRVYAHENILADQGKVALMRGPVVYCLEGIDHRGINPFEVNLPRDTRLRAEPRPGLLGGITVLTGKAFDANQNSVDLCAVPYHLWANRGKTPMTVWIQEPRQGGKF